MPTITKTEKINQHLWNTITELRKQGKVQLPTEESICQEVGASRGIVRRVMDELVDGGIVRRIAGKGTFIKEERDPKIIKSGKIPVLGMAYDIVELSEFRTRVIRSVARAAQQRGFEVMVCSMNETNTLLNSWFPGRRGMAELVGFISCSFTVESLKILNDSKRKIPYVALINPIYSKYARYSVLRKDHFELPFYYLAKLNHRRIWLMEHELNSEFLDQMRDALKVVQEKVGPLKVSIKECDYDSVRIDEDIARLAQMRPDERPSAILCHDDKVAAWVVRSIKKYGLKVPEDISVLGVGNFDMGNFTTPRLTTATISYECLGDEAVDLFIRQLNGEKIIDPIRYVNYHIVERETCAPCSIK